MRKSMMVAIAGATLLAGCQSARFNPDDPAAIAAIDSIVQSMMAGAREAIEQGNFAAFHQQKLAGWSSGVAHPRYTCGLPGR